MVDFPIENGDFPVRYVKLPEGMSYRHLFPQQSCRFPGGKEDKIHRSPILPVPRNRRGVLPQDLKAVEARPEDLGVRGLEPVPQWEVPYEAMVNTRYMVDGHPIHNKDPYNGYYKSLWTLATSMGISGP